MRWIKNLLDTDGVLTLYKAQAWQVKKYASLTWMSSDRSHLNLLGKVQRRAKRLIREDNTPPR